MKKRIRSIEYKLDEAAEYLQQLDNLMKYDKEAFLEDEIVKRAGERLFEILTQIIIDTCSQMTALLEVRTPETYADCIQKLGEKQILPKDEINKYENMIKMRNIIVHRYTGLDHELIYSSLKTLKSDFRNYRGYILDWIDQDN